MQIEKISLAVQVNGEACFVVLGQDKLRILVQLAQGLADNGKLNVVKAPEGFKFSPLSEL